MAGIGVEPYWELTFDADGDASPRQRDRLVEQASAGITDLVVFAHGWNNDQAMATELYRRFFAPFPRLLAAGRKVGYVGVLWPSMRFPDEPIPDFEHSVLVDDVGAALRPGLDDRTRRALAGVFPGQEAVIGRIAEILMQREDSPAAFEEFAQLVRRLVAAEPRTAAAPSVDEDEHEEDLGRPPAMLVDNPVEVCRLFTAALEESGVPPRATLLGDGLRRLWGGGQEVLRQATYYAMKRRAGTVGQAGLGPVLGRVAVSAPRLRIHLVGHSFGGRLVSFALRGLPEGVDAVKSVTLLQGAFSHYAFATRLPHARSRGGALGGVHRRVDGPVVSCFSWHDTALRVMYPLASRMAGDSAGLLDLGARWGAIGFDGIKAVDGAKRLSLADALDGPFPAGGCVSVDAAALVRRGGPPAGAHSDICHEELARIVLRAGRIGR